MEIRRTQFQAAGRTRIRVARDVVGAHARQWQVAAYLVHVGLGCWFKARIMSMANVATLSDLTAQRPVLAKRLFSGVGGHDLAALAREAALSRVFVANKEPDVTGDVWDRMCDAERPYSLRYGAAAVDQAQAEAELEVAQRVQAALEGVVR